MKLRRLPVIFSAIALALAYGGPVRADDDPLGYSDPGMHFEAPVGWQRVLVDQQPGTGDETLVAMWVYNPGKPEQRAIIIATEPFDGPLDDFEHSHESELRKGTDGTFIDKRDQTTLSNGMPAYWMRASQGSEAGHYIRRYEYNVIDTQRGITVSYIGRQGDFDEKDAKAALASLYVVVYPHRRG